MLSLFLSTTSLLLAFATSITASPLNIHNTAAPREVAEQWEIPRLNVHMMTRFTGIPGNNGWPESAKFPSTIDFTVAMPGNMTADCTTSWPNGTLPNPQDFFPCKDSEGTKGAVYFRLREYVSGFKRRPETSFSLQVLRVVETR